MQLQYIDLFISNTKGFSVLLAQFRAIFCLAPKKEGRAEEATAVKIYYFFAPEYLPESSECTANSILDFKFKHNQKGKKVLNFSFRWPTCMIFCTKMYEIIGKCHKKSEHF